MKHISDKIRDELYDQNWVFTHEPGCFLYATKTFPTGGAFGRTMVTVQITESGRWFERINGWGEVERELDLRDYQNDAKQAIKDVLNGL